MKIDPLDHRSHASRSVVTAQRTNPRAQTPVVDKRNYIRQDDRSTPAPAMKTNPATPRYKVPDADLYKLDRNLSERIAKASLGRVSEPPRPVSRAESTISSARYRPESRVSSVRPESRVNSFRPESRAGTYTVPKPPSSVISVSSSSPLPRVRTTGSVVSPRSATPVRAGPTRAPAVARAQTAPSPLSGPKLAASAAPAVKYRVPSSQLRTQLSFEAEEKKALVLEFTLSWSGVNDLTTLCLLDPKATTPLISEAFVKQNSIPKIKRETPIELLDAEKNPIPNSGKAYTHPLILRHQQHYTRESFEVATVDERVNVVLPAKWMERHELVDLFGGAQYFGTASCLQNCTKTNALKDPAARPPTPEPAPAPVPALRTRRSGNLLRSTVGSPAPAKRSVSGSGPVKRTPAVKPSSSPPKETLKPERRKFPSRSPARTPTSKAPAPSKTPVPSKTPAPSKTPTPGKKAVTPTRSPGRRVVSGEETRIPLRKANTTATTSPSSSAAASSPKRRATTPAPRRAVSPAISNVSSEFDPNPTVPE